MSLTEPEVVALQTALNNANAAVLAAETLLDSQAALVTSQQATIANLQAQVAAGAPITDADLAPLVAQAQAMADGLNARVAADAPQPNQQAAEKAPEGAAS